ncbi:MAG: PhnD/SsuA/transferrin family substrate-binding protein [Candidatus Schekmanbacteria bacterium]|nr:PhnD/SsuA/transferrin family substrate-binding protein [Candidatus Schekmanbacteria bacterium]
MSDCSGRRPGSSGVSGLPPEPRQGSRARARPRRTAQGVAACLLPALLCASAAADELASRVAPAAKAAAAAALPVARFAFFQPDGSGLPPADVAIGLQNYAAYFRKHGILELRTHYFRRAADLEAFLGYLERRGEDPPWLTSLSVSYMLTQGYRHGYEPFACGVIDGKTTAKFSLLARRGSDIRSLEDARGKILASMEQTDDARIWDSIVLFDNQIDVKTHFGGFVETDSPTSSVAAVIYGEADVAMVFKALFDRLSKDSQQVWRHMREVYASRETSIGSVQTWRGAPPEIMERVKRVLLGDIRKQDGGAEILDAFFLDGLQPCGWEDYDAREGAYMKRAGLSLVSGGAREAAIAAGGVRH